MNRKIDDLLLDEGVARYTEIREERVARRGRSAPAPAPRALRSGWGCGELRALRRRRLFRRAVRCKRHHTQC